MFICNAMFVCVFWLANITKPVLSNTSQTTKISGAKTNPKYGKRLHVEFPGLPVKQQQLSNPAFCICDNKDSDQLRGKREAN